VTQQAASRRYEPVWSVRPVRRAFAGTLIARTAQTMLPLTILLLFRQRTGSFAEAGIAVAVSGLAAVAGGPVTARLADRRGPPVLAVAGAVNGASLVLLAVTTSPALSWIAVAAAGVSVPPAGPALVSAATVLGGTADALFVASGLVVTGSALITRATRPVPAAPGPSRPPALPWLVIGSAQMAAIGFVEVAATARVIHLGHPAAAGTVLAVWAVGSMTGGLVYGGRDWPGPATGQLRALLLLLAAGYAIVSAAGNLAALYPLMFVAGLACAPAAAALTTSFSAHAIRTESFAWLASASSLGGSAGYAAGGYLVAHEPITAAFLVGAVLAVVAAAIVPRTPPSGHVIGEQS
jgi:predicted MFS family arabinose efflux permease